MIGKMIRRRLCTLVSLFFFYPVTEKINDVGLRCTYGYKMDKRTNVEPYGCGSKIQFVRNEEMKNN